MAYNVRHGETYKSTYNVGLQFLKGSSRIAPIGSVWFQFYNTLMSWAHVRR